MSSSGSATNGKESTCNGLDTGAHCNGARCNGARWNGAYGPAPVLAQKTLIVRCVKHVELAACAVRFRRRAETERNSEGNNAKENRRTCAVRCGRRRQRLSAHPLKVALHAIHSATAQHDRRARASREARVRGRHHSAHAGVEPPAGVRKRPHAVVVDRCARVTIAGARAPDRNGQTNAKLTGHKRPRHCLLT